MSSQPQLKGLQVPASVALVDVNFIRTMRSVDAETVTNMAESGEYQWVWDFSAPGAHRRLLRFWKLEVLDPTCGRGILLPSVIDTILPTNRLRFRSGELQALFTISAQLILDAFNREEMEGENTSTTLYIYRASLVSYLSKRLLSARHH